MSHQGISHTPDVNPHSTVSRCLNWSGSGGDSGAMKQQPSHEARFRHRHRSRKAASQVSHSIHQSTLNELRRGEAPQCHLMQGRSRQPKTGIAGIAPPFGAATPLGADGGR